jgi:hypothetical protein
VSPRTRQALIVAAAAVGIAAVGGIAAIQGWLPDWPSGDTPASIATPGFRVAGTAPADSLSPGESVVTAPEKAPPPPDVPPAPASAPAKPCPHCGTISSTTYYEREPRNARWEVRVRFDDGTRKVLRYPSDPGLRVGERVSLKEGRLKKE